MKVYLLLIKATDIVGTKATPYLQISSIFLSKFKGLQVNINTCNMPVIPQ
jgi:hypothetical protein